MARQQQGGAPRDPSHESEYAVSESTASGYAVEGAARAPEPIDITPIAGVDEPADDPRSESLDWLTSGAEELPGEDTQTVPLASRPASRARRIVLGTLVVLALAGGAVLAVSGYRIAEQKDATLRPPESIGGLRRDESNDATLTAENLRTALAAGIDLDETVSVVYADPAGRDRMVFFFGGTALLFSPERELDDVLDLLGEQGSGSTAMREVAAGELGGVMKCGTITGPDGQMSACGWADHGSLAVAMFPERGVAEAAGLMRQLRNATQTRS